MDTIQAWQWNKYQPKKKKIQRKKERRRRKKKNNKKPPTKLLDFSFLGIYLWFSMALHGKGFYSLLPSDCPCTFKYWQMLNICRSKALFSIIFYLYVQWLYSKVAEKKQFKPIATRLLLALQENPVSLNLTGDCCTLYNLWASRFGRGFH